MGRAWDLNADLGEGDAAMDMRLLEVVTSANVACGGHAGDASSMRRVCEAAAAQGVAIGAQVSYVDREGFGRRRLDVPSAVLSEQISEQIAELDRHAREAGTRILYVKPHGALYHSAAVDPLIAEAVLAGSSGLPMLTLPQGALRTSAVAQGIAVHAEAFADRGYLPDGHLVPRGVEGSLLESADAVADRVLRLVTEGAIVAVDGTILLLEPQSICVHSDTPGADVLARRVRAELLDAGAVLRPFASSSGGC